MNRFEEALANYIGIHRLQKIQQVKVGIAGAGGLGSNCAFNLVRSGFRQLKVVDFDIVEYTNLDRQFYFLHQVGEPKVKALEKNLKAINPNLELEVLVNKVEKENVQVLFEDCDIIVEAFDKAEYKALLVENLLSSGKLIVSASGLAGWGDSDEVKVHWVRENLVIIGDLKSEVGDDLPPVSPKVNIAAAKQADVILDYVVREEKNERSISFD